MPRAQRGSGLSHSPPADARACSSLRKSPRKLFAWADGQIRSLHPGSFALVMATGIVSNALFLQGPRRLSDLMFVANAVAYVWLAGLTIVRAARFPGVVWSDLLNPRLVFAFFSFVAATDVLGEGGYLRGFATTALYLWLLALFVWFVLIYVGFAVLTFLIPPARPTSFTADGCWRLSALNLWWFWALRSRR